MKLYPTLLSSTDLSLLVTALKHIHEHHAGNFAKECLELHDKILLDLSLLQEARSPLAGKRIS